LNTSLEHCLYIELFGLSQHVQLRPVQIYVHHESLCSRMRTFITAAHRVALPGFLTLLVA
jgi:hypothetical protein